MSFIRFNLKKCEPQKGANVYEEVRRTSQYSGTCMTQNMHRARTSGVEMTDIKVNASVKLALLPSVCYLVIHSSLVEGTLRKKHSEMAHLSSLHDGYTYR